MAQLFANNASSTLASGISDTATSLTLASGAGALFPAITGSDWFYLTLTQATTETSWEIVKVTARSDDVLTIVRAQEGTTAAAWASGSKAELRLTAATVAPLSAAASASVTGYLASADWSTFNGKQVAGSYAPSVHTHSYQAADADLLAIGGLTGTSGYLKKTAADTWTLDTSTFATGSGTASGTNTGDQTLPIASSTIPAALGVAAVGTGTTFARADHVHASPSGDSSGSSGSSGYEQIFLMMGV